ncbi:MAG TPA: VOC family protein, partial [Steroidobacteraceae bacterium]
ALRGLGLTALMRRVSLALPVSLVPLISLAPRVLRAQDATPSSTSATSQLPLHTTGLEHMGTVVPDVVAAARFYGRLFNPELYKEKDPPLRYYVPLGIGYLALGSRANADHAFFDHFCALVENYDAPAMATQLQALGLPPAHYGIVADPDGIGFQLLGTPGGLAKTTEPAGHIVEGVALVKPKRLAKVVLRVSDLDKSLQFYRIFFGVEAHRSGEQATFQIANTQLALRVASEPEPPRPTPAQASSPQVEPPRAERPQVERIVVECEPFDRRAVSRALAGLGARVATDAGRPLRFIDPVGLGLELQSA